MRIELKRVYEPSAETDGTRVLVERLWPRGLTKERAAIDFWAKDAAPSHELRKWFDHDPEKWSTFEIHYRAELETMPDVVNELLDLVEKDRTTFVFAAKDEVRNSAVVLRTYLADRVAS